MNSSSTDERAAASAQAIAPPSEGLPIAAIATLLWRKRLLMVGAPLLASAVALGISFLVPPTFTSRTSFLPPQQQSGGASALASLGALASLAGGAVKTNGDQYVAFVQSRTVADRIVDRFDLLKRYDREYRIDARKELAQNTRVTLGRKDGLITVEVDDHDPKTAAAMAAAYLEELRTLTANLTLTEAQQRRVFFEKQLDQIRQRLTDAQQALAATGISAGAVKAEPKATAEGFAKLQAALTTAEVKLQVLRGSMADGTAEVIAQSAQVAALRAELARLSQNDASSDHSGYITAYREFKYQEAVFDQMARQYELARVDESRDGGQMQVIDPANVPERRSAPKRRIYMMVAFALTFLLCGGLVLRREIVQKGRLA